MNTEPEETPLTESAIEDFLEVHDRVVDLARVAADRYFRVVSDTEYTERYEHNFDVVFGFGDIDFVYQSTDVNDRIIRCSMPRRFLFAGPEVWEQLQTEVDAEREAAVQKAIEYKRAQVERERTRKLKLMADLQAELGIGVDQ